MINKLTGEPVSAEMQNVLKRLANSENVPEAEIQQLKEIREANSCLGNGVPTIKLKDREGIQNGVYNRLQCSGSAVTDEISREKRLDIVIGLPASGKSSALVEPISEQYNSRIIDSDEAKKLLPEYNDGWGAGIVHTESQLIADRQFQTAIQKVFAYLCQSRKIDGNLVSELAHSGLLYQDKKGNAVLNQTPKNSRTAEVNGGNERRRYAFQNDANINYLSEQLATIGEFGFSSREQIYHKADELKRSIDEKTEKVKSLAEEIPTLKSDIAQLHYLFSAVANTSKPDAMTQIKLAAAQEIADKYGVRTEGDISSLEKRLKLLPIYISSIKDEISEEQLKLKRVSDLIDAYEKIVEGNYIDNLIRAQREQELTKNGEKRT